MNDQWGDNNFRVYLSILIFLLLILAFTPYVTAMDTTFRANPEHTGVYDIGSYKPNITQFSRFKAGDSIRSSPVVSNGVVYVGSDDIYAIDAVTGTGKWRFNTMQDVYSSPAVSNGVVYVGSDDYNLYAIDAVTGSEKWRFNTTGRVYSSPAVSNGVVYVGSDDYNLYAIDAVTGTEKWRFKTGNSVRSSPAVSNGVVYVGSNDGNSYAIDAVTGTEKWRFETSVYSYDPYRIVSSSPAVSNGVVYVGSNDGNLYAIDAAMGTEKWRFNTTGRVYSSPAVSNGVVYVGSNDYYLYAIDAVTGTGKWRFDTTGKVYSSPAVSNGVIYVGSDDKNLYAIDAGTGNSDLTLTIAGILLLFCIIGGGYYFLHSQKSAKQGNLKNNEKTFKYSIIFFIVIFLDLIICILFGLVIFSAYFNINSWSYHDAVTLIWGVIILTNFGIDIILLNNKRNSPNSINIYFCWVKSLFGFLGVFTVLSGLYFLIIGIKLTRAKKSEKKITALDQKRDVIDSSLPLLSLIPEITQFTVNEWFRLPIHLTNTGTVQALDITFTFTSEFETRSIKPISVDAGSSTNVIFELLPKRKGNVPLEIRVQYRDVDNKEYVQKFEYWVEVLDSDPKIRAKKDHHDVFVSYAQNDKTIADATCAKLESSNIRCWISPRDVPPGENFPKAIIEGIEGSKIMVLIFSSNSNNSQHVIREITSAVNKGLIIIPLRIEDIIPSKDMEYLISTPHWLDAITPPLEKHLDTLAKTIEKILSQTNNF